MSVIFNLPTSNLCNIKVELQKNYMKITRPQQCLQPDYFYSDRSENIFITGETIR